MLNAWISLKSSSQRRVNFFLAVDEHREYAYAIRLEQWNEDENSGRRKSHTTATVSNKRERETVNRFNNLTRRRCYNFFFSHASMVVMRTLRNSSWLRSDAIISLHARIGVLWLGFSQTPFSPISCLFVPAALDFRSHGKSLIQFPSTRTVYSVADHERSIKSFSWSFLELRSVFSLTSFDRLSVG